MTQKPPASQFRCRRSEFGRNTRPVTPVFVDRYRQVRRIPAYPARTGRPLRRVPDRTCGILIPSTTTTTTPPPLRSDELGSPAVSHAAVSRAVFLGAGRIRPRIGPHGHGVFTDRTPDRSAHGGTDDPASCRSRGAPVRGAERACDPACAGFRDPAGRFRRSGTGIRCLRSISSTNRFNIWPELFRRGAGECIRIVGIVRMPSGAPSLRAWPADRGAMHVFGGRRRPERAFAIQIPPLQPPDPEAGGLWPPLYLVRQLPHRATIL